MNTNSILSNNFQPPIQLRLAALWTAATFCYLYGDYFELYTPEKVDSLLSGEHILDSPIKLFIASFVMVIPPLMIPLSLLLKSSINRWLNLIFGSVFTIMMVLIAVGSLTPWYSFYVFLAIVEAVLTGIIVWWAFKWKKEAD